MSSKKSNRKQLPSKGKKQTLSPTLLWAGLGILVVILAGVFLFNPGKEAAAQALPREVSVTEAAALREAGLVKPESAVPPPAMSEAKGKDEAHTIPA